MDQYSILVTAMKRNIFLDGNELNIMAHRDIFEYASKTKVISGNKSTLQIPDQLNQEDAEKPLLVTDRNLLKVGVIDPVIESLDDAGFEYTVFEGVEPNPKAELIEGAANLFHKEDCDAIIAIGGGSSIDTAKAIGIVTTNGGDISEYYGSGNVPQRTVFPVITVPTTAGTGSEVTPASVISEPDQKRKMPILDENIFPTTAVLDPTLLESLPPHITAATGMDALTQAIMPYLGKGANPITDPIALESVQLIGDNLPKATAGESLTAYKNMQIATTLGGMVFVNAGLGLVHAMSHPVSGYFDTPHGITNAILLPHVLRYNRIAREDRYIDLAKALGANVSNLSDREASYELIHVVENLIADLEIPNRLRDIGVEEDSLPALAEATTTREASLRLVENNPRDATKEDILEIYESAF